MTPRHLPVCEDCGVPLSDGKCLPCTLKAALKAAYIKGWERAVWLYAVNKDGQLLVGVRQRLLKDVIKGGPGQDDMRRDLEGL